MLRLFGRSGKKEKFDFSLLKTDMHSHLLPGIDDGAQDLGTSIELIRGLRDLGYTRLITTPHIMWDMYRNTHEAIKEKEVLLNQELERQGIDMKIHAAAEYFLDEHVEELLAAKTPLLTISGKMVLVEFSLAFPSLNLKSLLFEIQMQGYQPVIAHPERYVYLDRNKEFYTELKDTGCLFQLNILSLGGQYGRTVTELAHYLLKNGFYSLVGTDLHHTGHLEAMAKLEVPETLIKIIESGQILNPKL